jgi:hypothetical protein
LQNTVVSVGLSGLLAWLSGAALASPPPGHYRIDSESTLASGSGMTASQVTQRTDGATGRITVVRKTAGMAQGVTQTIDGKGPVTWCVEPPGKKGPPAAAMPAACRTLAHSSSGTSSSHSAECSASNIEESWRRIDERTWERSLKATVQMAAASPADSARQAFEMMKHTMSPADRAKAQAELAALPSAGAMQAEMAPVIAQLEQQVRTGQPDEVAMAKQQLAALRSAGATGAGSTTQTTTARERWTRIADGCSAQR